jgi:hypothetical protein
VEPHQTRGRRSFPTLFHLPFCIMSVESLVANDGAMSTGDTVVVSETTTAGTTDGDSRSRNAPVKGSRRLIQPSIRKPAAKITVRSSKSSCEATDANLPVRAEEEADEEGPSPWFGASLPVPALRHSRHKGSRP